MASHHLGHRVVLAFQAAIRFGRISLVEFAQRDAGALGFLEPGHRDGQVQQAVGRAVARFVRAIILRKPLRRSARLVVIEIGPAQQIACIADPFVIRILLHKIEQDSLGLGEELGLPQPIAICICVFAFVIR